MDCLVGCVDFGFEVFRLFANESLPELQSYSGLMYLQVTYGAAYICCANNNITLVC